MQNEYNGLLLHGLVTNRLQRTYGNNKVLLTYVIRAGEKDYQVKEWNPEKENMLTKGELVNINIYPKVNNHSENPYIEYYIKKDDYGYLGEEV